MHFVGLIFNNYITMHGVGGGGKLKIFRVFHNSGWRRNCHCSSWPWVEAHLIYLMAFQVICIMFLFIKSKEYGGSPSAYRHMSYQKNTFIVHQCSAGETVNTISGNAIFQVIFSGRIITVCWFLWHAWQVNTTWEQTGWIQTPHSPPYFSFTKNYVWRTHRI